MQPGTRKLLTNTLLLVCRIVFSCTFILSGVLKLIDPMGMVYKLTEYLLSFGLQDFLPHNVVMTLVAIALGTFEFMIGMMVLFATHRKSSTFLAVLFMVVMTPFTLYLALANPVSECGCFGEAIKLTNWESFIKNIVLLGCAIVLRIWWKRMPRLITERGQWMIRLYCWGYAIVLGLYSYISLPPIDFLPYRIGTDVAHELTQDSSTISFMALDPATGNDYTEAALQADYSLLLISDNLAEANDGEIDRINLLATYVDNHKNMNMMMLTNTENRSIIDNWKDITGAEYPIYWGDESELRMMARSNPTLVLMKNGVIVNKWSHYNIPELDVQDLNKAPDEMEWTQTRTTTYTDDILAMLLWFVIPLFIWTILDRMFNRWKEKRKRKTIEKHTPQNQQTKQII